MNRALGAGREVNAVDQHVGGRVRSRRKVVRLSQAQLADELGLTFQQIQKYERGANRISASKLFDIARVLDVPISYFFDGLPGRAIATTNGADRPTLQLVDQILADETGALMLQSYLAIRSDDLRRQLAHLAATLSRATTDDDDATQH